MRRDRGELSCAECKRLKLKCDKRVPCGACVRRECQMLCPHGSLPTTGGKRFDLSDTEELKRARGELSCVNCKRLKLKCDKKLPCGACVRRGCSKSCPHSSAPNREASRSTSSNPPAVTEELLRKISELSHRIHLLEDALALLQSSISSEKHLLLRDDLLLINHGPEQLQAVEPETAEISVAETVDAFGTMTIGDSGESRYFGASAGSETLLSAESEAENPSTRDDDIPELLSNLAATLPMGSGCPAGPETFEIAINMLLSCLPSRTRAWSLCEIFLEQGSWLFRLVQREELIQDIFNPIYMAKQERENPDCLVATEISPHKISVLYSVFTLSRLMGLTLPGSNEEGDHYHQCARAALALRSIFDSPMVETVQAILSMTSYCSMSTQRYSRESVWMLSSVGSKVAQSLGMHRDPAQWNMDPVKAERRRVLFWEVYCADMHSSLALGRPPSMGLSYVDCALPQVQSDSDSEGQFWKWRYQFNKNIFGSVLELTLCAKSPNYETILELDRKVREMPLPPALNLYLGREDDDVSTSIRFKGGYLAMIRSITMLFIHKTYFARALLDHPANPLGSPYAASFLAATRCASAIIRSSAQYIKETEYYTRWWILWAQLFSAAMMTGLIVTRAPSSSFAPAALSELAIAVELFEDGAKVFSRVRIGMDILHRLQDKALLMFAQHRGGAGSPTETLQILPGQDGGNPDDLEVFSGQTRGSISRALLQKSLAAIDQAAVGRHLSSKPPLSFHASSSATSQSQSSNLGPMDDIHPSLMECISSFPQAGTVAGFTNREALNPFPASLGQPLPTGIPEPSHLGSNTSDFSSFQPPADLPPQQFQYHQASSTDFPYDSTSVDYWQQLYAETLATDTRDMPDIGQQGTASHSANGIDEDWVMFLKESGL
ncbi:hypothetical protein FIBSPDRAFT_1042717 [Athelia psychrophila]|uniref:Zn(2)-C6 fungal-type domain-containing protein n=1 Tax=Athelia psychrophila TaxID=1759441 RepID=A0A166MDF3_9AGAM|nr:hypothetical protein FIBSPDRAFT_1042717 [Fibularhizoctonia sp. CBS 109695]